MVGDFGGNEAWLYIAECEFVVGDSVAGADRRLGLGLFFCWLSGILSFFGGCGLFSFTFLLFFFSFSSEWTVDLQGIKKQSVVTPAPPPETKVFSAI